MPSSPRMCSAWPSACSIPPSSPPWWWGIRPGCSNAHPMTLAVPVAKRQGEFELDLAFDGAGAPVTALFGRSGAGKSSVIEMVAGLRRPDRGRIALGDNVLFDSEHRIDLPARRRRIGLVSQDGRLFPHYSVRGNLLYGYKRVPPAERRLELG